MLEISIEGAKMPKYQVYVQMMVSSVVEVEADSVGEALDLWYDSPDAPGGITVGAFGGASVDESGEWEATSVWEGDEVIWKDSDPA